MHFSRYLLALALSTSALTACGSDSTETPAAKDLGSAQLPPTSNGTDVEAWIKTASYKSWHCETASHAELKVSPHKHNRICSNDLIADFTGGVNDQRPKGSAAVKELWDDADATIVGYAVEVKVADTSDGGKNWYWYERTPDGVVADGKGDSGGSKDICVSCHTGAGSDDMHLVTKSSDYVYDVITN